MRPAQNVYLSFHVLNLDQYLASLNPKDLVGQVGRNRTLRYVGALPFSQTSVFKISF